MNSLSPLLSPALLSGSLRINFSAEDVGIVNLARSSAAMVCKEVTEIPGYGWFIVILDPSGAALALWQMKTTLRRS